MAILIRDLMVGMFFTKNDSDVLVEVVNMQRYNGTHRIYFHLRCTDGSPDFFMYLDGYSKCKAYTIDEAIAML